MDDTLVPNTPEVAAVETQNLIPKPNPGWLRRHRKFFGILVLIVILGGIGGTAYYYWQLPKIVQHSYQELPVGLISDKVSQSANLVIHLPDSIKLTPNQAEASVSFDPKISGAWTAGQTNQDLIFKPSQKLDLGKYYRVTVASAETRIQKDFLVDEDPKVGAIFPHDNTEAPETSAITIVFNRPMVPLTTLDQQLSMPLVTITPPTNGKFKWITTRTLQFIPDTRLHRSSNYKVSVGSGFTSVEGLNVAAFNSTFTTRPLRYLSDTIHHPGVTLYDEPIAIAFNQPVDLDKTKALIEIKNSDSAKDVSFVAEYGTRTAYTGNANSTSDYTDKSVIYLYQAKDRFGRSKFWDNKTSYNLIVKGGVPLEGDIKLDETRTLQVQVPDILESVGADSQRSNLVATDLFDPQGHLVLNFYEEVDKDKSDIRASGLKNLSYGQQCAVDDLGNEIMAGSDCQKQDNKKQLLISFNPDSLRPGQTFDLELAKIYNVKGLLLNPESIHQSVTVYPALQVFSTSPTQGEKTGSVTDLVICTNSPLQDAQTDTINKMLTSNVPFGKWNWDPAVKIINAQQQSKCAIGQYDNHIHYGLHPQTDYQLQLNLVDHFGQELNTKLTFSSGQIATINHNFYALQKDYNVASPQKTKLTYAGENLDYVDLQVCQVSAQTMLGYLSTRPDSALPGQKLNCTQTWQQKINLPPKYWDLNYFQVDLKDVVTNPLGYYILSFSNPNLRQQNYNYQTSQYEVGPQIYERTLLNVTNLAAQEKKVEVQGDPDIPPGSTVPAYFYGTKMNSGERSTERKILAQSQGNLYWVTQIGSQNPAENAQVQVYQNNGKGYNLSDTAYTDKDGIARAEPYAGDGAAVISSDNDSTIVSSNTDKFQWASSNIGGDKAYIYSDRPIYRPTQDVFIKGLYRIGYDGVYEIYDKPVHLEIFDSANNSVFKQDLKLTKQGTFNTKFTVPSDAPLGSYRVEALGGTYNFDVEEYVPAAFKLDLSNAKDEYIAGENFTVNVDANYYFGVPVEGGEVSYNVVAQNYYFDRYQDANFQFGSGWYYSQDPSYGDNFILTGKAPIGSDGKAQISGKLDFSKLFNGDAQKQSKIFVVQITAKNTTGQSISGQESFIVHRGLFYLGVNLQNDYFAKNQPNKILIKTVDTQGKELSVQNITGKVNKITWNYFKRQEVDGGYYYTADKKLTSVSDINATTDSHGNYSMDFTVKDEGEYEIDINTTDKLGNPIVATQGFYVYGEGTVQVEPLNNDSLDLAVQNNQLDVGQSTNIVIKSPFPKAKALVAIERGRILDYQIVDVNQSFYNYNVQVKDSYLPNFYVTVLLLSPDPEVRFGQAEFYVNTKQKTISIEAEPDKANYLPGEQVTLDVATKDSDGKAISADVSLSVADLSVLALAGNPKKDPVSFFYAGMPLSVTTASNIKNILVEAQIPSGTKGGGGADPADLANKKRGVFKDTAYWNADVTTDQSGHAQVKFTLPDNLTTWQVESLGLTEDTKLGVGYGQFVAKQLMVTPLIPRFILPGDDFVVGGKVFNQTGASQTMQVTLDSPGLTLKDKNSQSLTLAAGQTSSVYFKVSAPANIQDGQHTVTITAKNSQYQDSVENSFPIKQNNTYESVATANYTTDSSASEYVWLPQNVVPNKGGVTVKAEATLAGVIPDALNYLTGYPYGCTEQMMSKLEAVATAKRFTQIKNLGDKFKIPDVQFDGQTYSADDVISIGTSRILSNQNSDGGFAYYPKMKSDLYLTLDVLNALQQIKAAGYKVDQGAIDRGAQYAYQTYTGDQNLYNSKDTLILISYTLSQIPSADTQFASLKSLVMQLDNNQKYLNEDISNLSLTYLAILSVNGKMDSLEQKAFATLENRVIVDGRGSYLGNGTGGSFWWYYETPAKDTALLVKAESLAKRDYQQMLNLLRWLRSSRAVDGSWASTNNTVTVLDALVDYLQFKPENQSNFNLELMMGSNSFGSQTFGGQTVTDVFATTIPESSFSPNKLTQINFVKKNLNDQLNGFYYDMSLKYYLPVDNIAPRDEGFSVQREMYALSDKSGKTPLASAKVGDVLRAHLTITTSKPRNLVGIESYIPAGMELVNFGLATEDQSLQQQVAQPGGSGPVNILGYQPVTQKPVQVAKPGFWTRSWRWIKGLFVHRSNTVPSTAAVSELPDEIYSGQSTQTNTLYPDSSEYHDDRLMLFNQQLSPGVYEYDYFVRALIPGKFQHLPAVASELYTPENFGRSRGEYFEIKQ